MTQIADFEKIYENRHSLARGWKKEGKKVYGYFCSLMPEEMLHAGGIIPVQLTENEDGESLRKGKVDIPEFFCSYSLSCAGQGMEDVYGYLDGVVFTDACPQLRTVFDIWDMKGVAKFIRYFIVPNENNEDSREFYVSQMKDFKGRIEKSEGVQITDEALKKAIEVYNENRRLVRELYATRKSDNPPFAGSEIAEIIKAGIVMPRDEHSEMVKSLLESIPSLEPRKVSGRPRLMAWTHVFEETNGRMYPNFMKMIEELGGEIVADELHRGSRYSDVMVGDNPDPWEALAERYIAHVPHSWKMSDKDRIKNILESVEEYRVDGIVFFVPKFCQTDWFQQYLIEKACKEKGIPYLSIETLAGMPQAPVRTRLEAFLEMLEG